VDSRCGQFETATERRVAGKDSLELGAGADAEFEVHLAQVVLGRARAVVGLSVPMVGAGVALDPRCKRGDTVLGCAVLVGLGVAGGRLGLLGRGRKSSPQAA
jgi:hypothetical protein